MGQLYSLSHLAQRSYSFDWTVDNVTTTYTAWVRYSNHCYSESVGIGVLTADDVVVSKNPLRTFCPIRFGETPRLVGLVADMMAKPTTRVARTSKGNYSVYQLYVKDGEQNRYCVFFTVKPSLSQPGVGHEYFLDVHIESAYLKDQRVGTVSQSPLGKIAHLARMGAQ